MAKCVIEGCGKQIHPVRLAMNPRIKTCSPACAYELVKFHRRQSALRAMERKRKARQAAKEAEEARQGAPPKKAAKRRRR